MVEDRERPIVKAARDSNEVMEEILRCDVEDTEKFDDLTNLFYINQKKQDIALATVLNGTRQVIWDEIAMRVSTTPEEIPDKDLMGYANLAQSTLNSTLNTIKQQPAVQINTQTNINIDSSSDGSGLSLESRKAVADMVSKIINQTKNQAPEVIDAEFKETK